MKRAGLLVVAALLLGACGQTTPPTSSVGTQPALPANIHLTLFVPAPATARPQYISASTASLRLQVGDTDQSFQLSDGTPVDGGTRYRFAVRVAPGQQQVVKVSTFNAQDQLLSQATQLLDLAAGGDNTFDLTLVGEAVSAGLTFDANSNVTSGPSVLLDRGGAYTLGSALQDASGNIILDAGRPADLLCSSDGSFTVSGANGAFTLTAPEPTDMAQNTVLTAHVGDCSSPDLGQLVVTVPAEQIGVTLANAAPDTGSPLIATARLLTARGNALPIASRAVTFTVTEQGTQVSTFSGVTDATGQLTTRSQDGLTTGAAAGTGTVTATSGAVSASSSYTSASGCGPLITLAVGQVQQFSGNAATKLCLPGGTARQSYAVIPVNTTSTSQTLKVTGTGIVASEIQANSLNPGGPGIGTLSVAAGPAALVETPAPALSTDTLNTLMRQPLSRIDRPIQSQAIGYGLPQGSVPAVDSMIALNVAQGCTGTPDVRLAQVRAVTDRAIVLEEVALNPSTGTYSPVVAGGFSKFDYDGIGRNFDIAYTTLTSQFGAPADIDGNGHVAIFYTKAMNELSPAASSAITYGQFNSRDLFSKSTSGCTLSNQGELMYMAVPDPTGQVNSNVRTFSTILGNAGQTLAGEFTRLINASRRMYVTGTTTLEEPWLDQGLADEGRMLMFYRATAGQLYNAPNTGTGAATSPWTQSQAASCGPLAPLGNIVLSNLTSGACASIRVAAFNTYANAIFTKFRPYLQRPDLYSIYTTGTTPPTSPTQPFLQYAADRVVSTSSDQRAFWSSLIDSNLQGVANLQRAFGGADPKTWIRDWSVSNALDDKFPSGVDPLYQSASWNWRSVFSGLGGYPLLSRPLSDATPLTLAYAPGSASYMVLGVDPGKQAAITVTDPDNTLPTDVSVSVVRLK